jgi:hypothetical protein
MSSHEIRNEYDLRTTTSGASAFRNRRGYKFYNSSYATDLFRLGRIRIGTLAEFRGHENSDLSDRYEGCRVVKSPDDRAVSLTQLGLYRDDDSVLLSAFQPQSKHVHAADDSLIVGMCVVQPLRDYHMFCYSREASPPVALGFKGYDSVAYITDVFRLAEFIVTHIDEFFGFDFWVVQVVYRAKEKSPLLPPQPKIEALFEKPLRFSSNREARVFFVPPNDPDQRDLEPCFVSHPRLTRFFRPMNYPLAVGAA